MAKKTSLLGRFFGKKKKEEGRTKSVHEEIVRQKGLTEEEYQKHYGKKPPERLEPKKVERKPVTGPAASIPTAVSIAEGITESEQKRKEQQLKNQKKKITKIIGKK